MDSSDSELFLDTASQPSTMNLSETAASLPVDLMEEKELFESATHLSMDDTLALSDMAADAGLLTSQRDSSAVRSDSIKTSSSTVAESALNDACLPGHLNALTLEQTKMLYHLWHILLNEAEHQDHAMGGHLLPQLGLSSASLTASAGAGSGKSSQLSIGKSSTASSASSASSSSAKKSLWSFRSKSSKASIGSAHESEKPCSQSSLSTEPSQEELRVRIKREPDPASELPSEPVCPAAGSFASLDSHPDDDPIFKSTSSCPTISTASLSASSATSKRERGLTPCSNAGAAAASELLIQGHTPMTSYAEELWRGFLLYATDPDAMLLRFLRARKWHLSAAATMALNTVEWRANAGIFDLLKRGESCCDASLWRSGKTFFYGIDRQDRTVIYIHVRLHDKNANSFADNQKYTLYNMEMARRLLMPGTETCTLVFDMTGFTLANMDYPSTKFLVSCFQSYYPESLAKAYIVSAPWIFNAVWRMIRPWLDPVVASKVFFVKQEELTQFIAPEYLIRTLGGSASFVYSYAPAEAAGETAERSAASLNVQASQSQQNMSGISLQSSTLEALSAPSVSLSNPSPSLLELKRKYLDYKSEFVQLTRQVHALLAPIAAEADMARILSEHQAIVKRRQTLKDRLMALSLELDDATIPTSHYQRLGVIRPGGGVDWHAAAAVSQK